MSVILAEQGQQGQSTNVCEKSLVHWSISITIQTDRQTDAFMIMDVVCMRKRGVSHQRNHETLPSTCLSLSPYRQTDRYFYDNGFCLDEEERRESREESRDSPIHVSVSVTI